MRFPPSSTAFYHYLDLVGLETAARSPTRWRRRRPSTVVDLEGESHLRRAPPSDLPPVFHEVADAWREALEEGADFSAMPGRHPRARRRARSRRSGTRWCRIWDDRTFYGFLATSRAFASRSFRHREIFGQVGFGTGGWDTDFPNSMLEILRVVYTNCDEDQRRIVGGVEQLPRRLWRRAPPSGWRTGRPGTTLATLHDGAPRPGVARIAPRPATAGFTVTDRWGDIRDVPGRGRHLPVLAAHHPIDCDESLFPHRLWMAIERTHYMQSSKTFVLVDRPFWQDKDPATGRDGMSMTLTDRMTRGTYLLDHGPDRPAVICLSYTWMGDALKWLPLPRPAGGAHAGAACRRSTPGSTSASTSSATRSPSPGRTTPTSWARSRRNLPGHYRYQRRLYCHFMQDGLPPARARHLPRRRRHLLDPGRGRGRGHHGPQRGLGHPAPSRRPDPRTTPGPATGSPSSPPSHWRSERDA